ncbi:MATE family efflux transporter [Vibrio ostreicida]|uniref:MATE family efflux transporter n=1 Tax=Vibrio ostreicida TaxID=526588 RepID=UPI003B5AEEE8
MKASLVHRFRAAIKQLSFTGNYVSARCFDMFHIICEGIIVAQISHHAVAAMAVATALTRLLRAFSYGAFSGTSLQIAEGIGQQDNGKISTALIQGLVITLVVSVVCGLICLQSEVLFTLMGIEPQITQSLGDYLFYYAFSIPFFYLSLIGLQLFLAFCDTRSVMIVNLVYHGLCITLQAILALGLFGVPQMGMLGMGLSYLCASLAVFLLTTFILARGRLYREIEWLAVRSQSVFSDLARNVVTGCKLSLASIIEWLSQLSLTVLAGLNGVYAMIAQQVALQSSMAIIVLCVGFTNGLSVLLRKLLSQNAVVEEPEKHADRTRDVANTSIMVITGVTLLASLSYIVIPRTFIDLFAHESVQNDPQLMQFLYHVMMITSAKLFFDMLRTIVGNGVLRGYNDLTVPPLITLGYFMVIGVGLGGVLTCVFEYDAEVLFIMQAIAFFITAMHLLARWMKLEPVLRLVPSYESKL